LSAVDELAATNVTDLPDAAIGPELQELYLARTRLDAEINRRVSVFDRRRLARADGAPTTQSWLRSRVRLAPSDASAEVHTARGLRDLSSTAAAWRRGDISRDHVRAITLLAKETSIEATQNVEEDLVEVARKADPLRFSTELRKWRDALRRDSGADNKDESEIVDRRELNLVNSLDGMAALKGWLTPEVGELARAVLDPLAAPLPGDTRTAVQRYHDAFAEVLRRVLGEDAVAPGHKVRPQLLVLTDFEGLIDADKATMAELGYGGLINNETLQRIACDSVVSRVLLSPQGEILDLGRSVRTVTPAQWKALVVRDGGCVAPGCDRPAVWCDAHHLKWWTRDHDPTDLDNLALLCGFHHQLVHEGGWTLRRHTSGRWILRRPDGTDIDTDDFATAIGRPIGRPSALRAVLNPPPEACAG
jgi:hypothetical protein